MLKKIRHYFRTMALCTGLLVLVSGVPQPVCAMQFDGQTAEGVIGESTQAVPSQGIYDFVERMYEVFLGRASDPEGKENWANALATGEIDGAGFVHGFAHSEEFHKIYNSLTDEEFVAICYRTFLGREPDPAGFQSWVEQAGKWAPFDWMIGGFMNSLEFGEICNSYGIIQGTYERPYYEETYLNGDAVGAFVERFYTKALGRPSDPDGKRDWATKIATGEIEPTSLVYGFLDSSEFQGRSAKMSNEEYVTCMYHTFFDRDPDPEGFATWVSSLNEGTATRRDIIDGFVGSVEYRNLMDKLLGMDYDSLYARFVKYENDLMKVDGYDAFETSPDSPYYCAHDQKDENGRVVEIGDTLTLDKVLASLEEFGYFLMLYCPAGSNDLMESHYEPVKSNADLAALQELDYKASMRLHQMADRNTFWVKGAYIGAPCAIELWIMKNGDGSYSYAYHFNYPAILDGKYVTNIPSWHGGFGIQWYSIKGTPDPLGKNYTQEQLAEMYKVSQRYIK